jgi:hypothetical protein
MKIRMLLALALMMAVVSACIVEPVGGRGYYGGGYRGGGGGYHGGGDHDYGRGVWRG